MTNPKDEPLFNVNGLARELLNAVGKFDAESLFGTSAPKSDPAEELLAHARNFWNGFETQGDLTGKQKAYLRGQAELIAAFGIDSGALTYTPLQPDMDSLVAAITQSIVPA